MNETSRLTTISELSTRCGVTHRALRFYEARGLLSPLRRGRQRLYSDEDGQKLSVILSAKRMGFGLEDIKPLLVRDEMGWALALSQSVAAVQIELLRARLAETQMAIDALKLSAAQPRRDGKAHPRARSFTLRSGSTGDVSPASPATTDRESLRDR